MPHAEGCTGEHVGDGWVEVDIVAEEPGRGMSSEPVVDDRRASQQGRDVFVVDDVLPRCRDDATRLLE